MRRTAQVMAGWVGGAALLLGMPLLGVWLAGASVAPYLHLPPRTNLASHASFSWPAFCGLAILVAASLAPVVRRLVAAWPKRREGAASAGSFPWWGWASVAAGVVFWVLAWTRFPWFRPLQPFTFTPLWLAYIGVMNGLAWRQTGRSPLTHRTGPFLALFPLSALFWWGFEYLNRFVENWHYLGVEHLTAGQYVWRATFPFATVLPAFVATRAWLAGYPGLWRELEGGRPLVPARPRRLAWLALMAAGLGLAGIGLWPKFLFPLLWVAPLVVMAAIRFLSGKPTLVCDPVRGEWRRLAMAALAALICGFFWELWNVFSQEKWIYTVPFVDRFHLFEMPLLGYAGYLPFGIECALVAEWMGFTGEEDRHE